MAIDARNAVTPGPRGGGGTATAGDRGTGPGRPDETERVLSGLDALELAGLTGETSRTARIWAATWPKLLAVAIFVGAWQMVVLSGWRPEYSLAPPADVAGELIALAGSGEFWQGLLVTLRRAAVGFALATVIGLVLGAVVARVRVLRAAFGSMITALQTMPSIAWFPLAILLLQLSEGAIQFVVILGAAPSIANGVIAGVDYVPPLLLRVGHNLGARGIALYRHVIAPASLPSIVAGLKQGWAFAWRSLMAGELLVIIPGQPSIGAQLQFAREFNQAAGLVAVMVVIFALGVLVDVAFTAVDRAVRRRWGMV